MADSFHFLVKPFYFQTYEEWKDMLPDFSEYNWVIPDFVWELSEQIDLGKCVCFHGVKELIF